MTPSVARGALWLGVVVAVVGHAAFGLAGSSAQVQGWTRAIFVGTILVEILALIEANAVRLAFAPGDRWRSTWGMVVGFLALRIVAELRLATLNFDLVPTTIADSESLFFFYRVVLRYLYTLSDGLAVAALASAVLGYRAAGLDFRLRPVDSLVALVVAAVPVLAIVLRDRIGGTTALEDPTIVTYRLVAACVGTVVAGLSLVLLRYVRQMGGGTLARVWGAASLAGIARTLSFLALAVLANFAASAEFIEQLLLLIFACAWLFAAAEQRTFLRGT